MGIRAYTSHSDVRMSSSPSPGRARGFRSPFPYCCNPSFPFFPGAFRLWRDRVKKNLGADLLRVAHSRTLYIQYVTGYILVLLE